VGERNDGVTVMTMKNPSLPLTDSLFLLFFLSSAGKRRKTIVINVMLIATMRNHSYFSVTMTSSWQRHSAVMTRHMVKLRCV
jgi:hypothetical protein